MNELSKPYYSAEELAGVFSNAGYKAEIDALPSGRKVIRSSAAGHKFNVYTYGPKDNLERIRTMQFTYGVVRKPPIESVNKWNENMRFGRAYLDDEGDLWLDWDCVLTYASPAYVKECLEWWEISLGKIDDLV